ncbi:MAG TPA: HAMP domain-containing sensor histidine kinase [Streptosporangiaceae bacterium]|nr:HAMP domain-containing sensor histidine kinase [Streptosporangiaceae bacterium]
MASRIVAAVLVLITALLATLAVPLGLVIAAQDRADFRDQTAATAGSVASVAEERLGDGVQGRALNRSITELAQAGDRVAVYNAAGQLVAGTSGPRPAPGASDPDRLVVAAPILDDSGTAAIGRVVLSRPTESVEHRVTMLWALIAGVTAGGLIVSAFVAAGLARWASRPLTALAGAAGQLGDGALDTRARVESGPPEVRALAAAFNTMAARLQALVHGHRAMMAEVSHQVRTPLAALRLRLDLLAQDADDATAAELAGAQEEIARLARLVNGLLAVARAENVTAAPAEIDVPAVLADRAAAWRPAAEERGIILTADCRPALTARAGDGHLQQILDNLLANALDALPDGGTIAVSARPARPAAAGPAAAEVAAVAVADNGRGMSRQQQYTAFRRFATGSPGGTGLGLAIVDRLAAANGGTVALSDTPGGGLTVTVELPLIPPARGSRRPAAVPMTPAEINRF